MIRMIAEAVLGSVIITLVSTFAGLPGFIGLAFSGVWGWCVGMRAAQRLREKDLTDAKEP